MRFSRFIIGVNTLLCIAIGCFLFYIKKMNAQSIDDYIEIKLALRHTQINATIENLRNFSTYVFEKVVDQPSVKEILCQAWNLPVEKRHSNRNQLWELLKTDYHQIEKYHFRQLHFAFPDNTSFLRLHSPTNFGDNLSSIRATMRTCNETQQPIFGFEEGRIFNGYRFVYPLHHLDRHCGLAEVSFSMKKVLEILTQITHAQYQFVIDRSVVESIVFEKYLNNYEPCPFSKDFLHDKNVRSANDHGVFSLLDSLQTHKMRSLQDFGYFTHLQQKDYLLLYKVIHNFEGKGVAYIISLEEDDFFVKQRQSYHFAMRMTVLLGILLLASINFFIYERRRLKKSASTDSLTQLYNRHYFTPLIQQEMERNQRYKTSLCLIMVDIDHFKSINDTYGHNLGDTVLKRVASLLLKSIRKTDSVGRWGGEEFMILLPNTTLIQAHVVAEKIRYNIEQASIIPQKTITISLGIAEHHQESNPDPLIQRADAALYHAKERGRNQVADSP